MGSGSGATSSRMRFPGVAEREGEADRDFPEGGGVVVVGVSPLQRARNCDLAELEHPLGCQQGVGTIFRFKVRPAHDSRLHNRAFLSSLRPCLPSTSPAPSSSEAGNCSWLGALKESRWQGSGSFPEAK